MTNKNPIVTIEMENGNAMKIELYPDKAPISVANFVDLVQSGFYDGLSFHRVVKGFMIQGGSKSGSCAGEDLGFTIKGEFKNNGVDTGLSHKRGAISMARTMVADSASTQFFICHQDVSGHLDHQYAVFGMLVEGLDVLDEISVTPTKSQMEENRPLTPQIMKKLTVELGDYQPIPPERIGEMKQ